MMATETKNTKVFYNTEIPSDWELKKLDKIFEITAGGDIEKEFVREEKDDEFKYPIFANAGKKKGLYGYSNKYRIDFDCVTLSGRGEIGLANARFEKFYPIVRLLVLKPKLQMDLMYIENYLNKLNIHQESTGVPQLTAPQISKYKILFPPHPEQRAIAQVLSTADAAIHTTEKLIAQKELRKKWLMQQLLTGKKRLKGFENTKWKIQPLENFIKPIVRKVPKPKSPYLGIGLRSHGKGTFLKHEEQPEKNSMDNFYVVRPNDLIVNITFAWEQAIAIVRTEDDGALASHRFPTYTFIEDKGHPDFFRFYILQPRMKFMLQIISPGGAGRNRVMSKSDFIKFEFLLPDYKEQTAIAQVLQAADKEISILKAKAEKLREQKKWLMQQLLTGKVRLKINE